MCTTTNTIIIHTHSSCRKSSLVEVSKEKEDGCRTPQLFPSLLFILVFHTRFPLLSSSPPSSSSSSSSLSSSFLCWISMCLFFLSLLFSSDTFVTHPVSTYPSNTPPFSISLSLSPPPSLLIRPPLVLFVSISVVQKWTPQLTLIVILSATSNSIASSFINCRHSLNRLMNGFKMATVGFCNAHSSHHRFFSDVHLWSIVFLSVRIFGWNIQLWQLFAAIFAEFHSFCFKSSSLLYYSLTLNLLTHTFSPSLSD